MNWDAISFDWNHIRAFLAVVEQGSLSAAARTLRQTQPTLSRQIAALEEALQVSLFTRGTREMRLTDAGLALVEHVRAMAESAAQISRLATGRNQAIDGSVRLSCTDAMAAYVLPRCLAALRESYPGVHTELVASNELSDLTRREADIAIRHQRPEQPDLIAKQVGEVAVSLFASEAYLKNLGNPQTPEAFSQAHFLGFEHPARLVNQVCGMGVPVTAKNFAITTSNGVTLYELARQGLGVALLPRVIAESHLGLHQILPNLPVHQLPIWLVTHRDVQTSQRIRLCFDLLSRELAEFKGR